ncbi:DMT family transporter [Piscirickettsia litoralis]|uniref:Guanidinium exporter n=1 Tax=Piscirickettsia litoralis TaxID=1891921 RepID=A0ABX3A462_9GAMM|nr:multidrug efflux SMR transporter [Piscirickettsia litoralis]ODN42441.1 multidrug transporter [Piscirickettsia litoralis]
MAWLYLAVASITEILWALALKFTNGFQEVAPSLIVAVCLVVSFYCLAMAVKTIPIGTAYAIWTGTGAAGTALLGMVIFDDSTALLRVLSITAIIAGVVGLKLFSSDKKELKRQEVIS